MGRVVYVRGFPSSFTNPDLKAKFMPFGRVQKARITSNDQKHFGIVTYYYEEHAKIAMQALNDKTIEGITWYATECEKLEERNSSNSQKARKFENRPKTLYLRDFPADLTTDKLKEIFVKYGLISSVYIRENIAFVTFDNPEMASKALEAEKFMKLEGKRVYVNKLKNQRTITYFMKEKKKLKIAKENAKVVPDNDWDDWGGNEGWD